MGKEIIFKKVIKRNKSNKILQRGYLIALKKSDSTVKIGFSLCSKYDFYDKIIAENIALGRAKDNKNYNPPNSLIEDIELFKIRIKKYFKDVTEIYC